jgi:hypothetical protein
MVEKIILLGCPFKVFKILGQEERAGAIKEEEGNLTEALTLFLRYAS